MLPIRAFRISALRLTWNDCLWRALIQPGWKITRGLSAAISFTKARSSAAGTPVWLSCHSGVVSLTAARRESMPVTKRSTKSLSYASCFSTSWMMARFNA